MSISSKHKYIPAYQQSKVPEENAWILIITDKKLVMRKEEDSVFITKMNDLEKILPNDVTYEYFGCYDEHECFYISMQEIPALPENLELVGLREITARSGDQGLFLLAGTASHILHWDSINQYCGRCGHKTNNKENERAKVCPNCGNLIYPRISPATITAIFHEDKILLAHNSHFKKDMYSLIAGYVEVGESLEQCVEREIREEVGIKVKNIRYWNSQPWPFPDGLMVAFTAEYESGEIAVDHYEITDAGWYHADNLPDIPQTDSIAGKMIRWYREQYSNNKV